MVRTKTIFLYVLATCLVVSTCKKNVIESGQEPDSPPTITSFQPSETEIVRHIGNVIEFVLTANDSDGDEVSYKFLNDGIEVGSSSDYSWTVNKKGTTTILGIAYNDLADTTEWIISVENQAPQANSFSLDMVEDEPKSIAKESLGADPDGDNISYRIINEDKATFELEVGNITFRGNANYFGPASIEFEISDGELVDVGRVDLNITNTADDPIVDAGTDKTGTIDEDIQLDGGASSHPDDPISTITSYAWNALNGDPTIENSENTIATFRATTSGTYDIELTITDDKGVTAKDTVSIHIDSYKLTVNTTNVLTDAPLAGLEVMLAGKTAFTNSEGKATLEYPTNTSQSGNLSIKDENIVGDIGDFFNYSDTESTNIDGDKELYIEMVQNVEFDSQFYTDIFDFLTKINTNHTIVNQPGDYDEDYPVPVNTNESNMPADYYKRATDEAIDEINQELGMNVFEKTTGEDARYTFDYSQESSRFSPNYVQKDGVWYIDDATIYINKNALNTGVWFEILKAEMKHELIHGIGWTYHSLDPQDLMSVPVWDSNTSQNEINAANLQLKLQGGTNLENYQLE